MRTLTLLQKEIKKRIRELRMKLNKQTAYNDSFVQNEVNLSKKTS